jgi:hypothetical protein
VYLSALTQTDVAVTGDNAQVAISISTSATENSQQVAAPVPGVLTNTSAQIRSRLNQGGSLQTLRIKTNGWIDRRGRDD